MIEIRKSGDEQFYFVVVADNHKVITTSEMYTRIDDCEEGIEAMYRALRCDINYKT